MASARSAAPPASAGTSRALARRTKTRRGASVASNSRAKTVRRRPGGMSIRAGSPWYAATPFAIESRSPGAAAGDGSEAASSSFSSARRKFIATLATDP